MYSTGTYRPGLPDDEGENFADFMGKTDLLSVYYEVQFDRSSCIIFGILCVHSRWIYYIEIG